MLLALLVAPGWWGRTSGQEVRTTQAENAANRTRIISEGRKANIKGIVIDRDRDGFVLRETDGTETFVVLTCKTEIKTDLKGLFRSDKVSGVNQILQGVRVIVDVIGNPDGKVVARHIRFDERDLRTAQSLKSRVAAQASLPEQTAVIPVTNVP
jgi:hypothetical protein